MILLPDWFGWTAPVWVKSLFLVPALASLSMLPRQAAALAARDPPRPPT
jgi:hypothetical protein